MIKGQRVPWLRIEKPGALISIHVTRPLEVAVEMATIARTPVVIDDTFAIGQW
jgi:hypothetical protein